MSDQLSRISKLFLDRDQTDAEAALLRRQAHTVILKCGDDVAASYTLQLAALTAARIASRCFPGAVEVEISDRLAAAPLLLWPTMPQTIGAALQEAGARRALGATGSALLFGDTAPGATGTRVTFDGWVARVGPASMLARASEREFFSAAGVLAAALAMSEVFLAFAGMSVAATRRVVGLSLWRPDLAHDDADALGVPVIALPREMWILGLGHLGNAYLWTLASLPYQSAADVKFYLNDFDKVSEENFETSVLFAASDSGALKTRVTAAWLEARRFRTRLVERRFDRTFRRFIGDADSAEPGLAFCGFDSNAARRGLGSAEFLRVVESGLGGRPHNFDTIALHTLPNARAIEELWPDLTQDEQEEQARRLEQQAKENAGYGKLGKDECGRIELAGKAIAVPFVGAAAASLVVAESVRLLHDGPRVASARISLGDLARRLVSRADDYTTRDAAGIAFEAVAATQVARPF